MQRCIGLLLVLLGCFPLIYGALPAISPFDCGGDCSLWDLSYPSPTTMLWATRAGKLYYSQDEGQTWTLKSQQVYSINPSPNNSNYIVVLTQNRNDFLVSTDGGNTFVSRNFPNGIRAVQVVMNSVNPTYFLIEFLYPSATSSSLAITKDLGATWLVPMNMENFSYTGATIYFGTPSQPDSIFLLRSDAAFGYWQSYATFNVLFSKSAGFVVTDNFLFVGVFSTPTSLSLYASSNRHDPAHTQVSQYLLAEFPFGSSLPQYGYTFLDDSTRSEFLGVVRSDGSSRGWGTVFSSDFDGDIYTFVLNFTAEYGLIYDFDKFNGLAGIYVANVYRNATTVGGKQTKITYDNGGSWRLLPAPATDANGNPTNCQVSQGCSLHLHGLASWYSPTNTTPPFYSSSNAIGLMVAVGNLGSSVIGDRSQQNTYFTRDGGLTWTTLFAGPTIYEFGDHGGILVWAPTLNQTDRIYYSFDEGATINSAIFSSYAVWVDNIIIEPSGTGQKFVVLARNSSQDFLVGIDFSTVINTPCTDSDYENWSPSDGEHGSTPCFMGATTVYQRRKQSSSCYNNRDTDHVLSQTPCPCAWADYECDIGFAPSDRNSTDGFSCTAYGQNVQPCSTGYKLVPDTLCTLNKGALDINSYPCPVNQKSHHGALVAVILLLVFIFLAAGAVAFLYFRNENFREFVLSKLSSLGGSGGRRGPEYSRVNVEEHDEDDG